MDAVWASGALARMTAGIADEPNAAVGEVQGMRGMAEAPDGQFPAVQAIRPDRYQVRALHGSVCQPDRSQARALPVSVCKSRSFVARRHNKTIGMRGCVRHDHDFTDRLIRGRLADPVGKHRGLVRMPAGDAAHQGVSDQNTGPAVEVVNPVIHLSELTQRLYAFGNRQTGLELMIAVHEDHAVECFPGSEYLNLGALQRA